MRFSYLVFSMKNFIYNIIAIIFQWFNKINVNVIFGLLLAQIKQKL